MPAPTDRQALREIHSMAMLWRYSHGVVCPACRQAPHTADCFLVALVDRLEAALAVPEGTA